jgi:hypothetical protein
MVSYFGANVHQPHAYLVLEALLVSLSPIESYKLQRR